MKVQISSDGNIHKTIIKEGYGDCPVANQEVTINYITRLSNKKEVDSTMSRNSPFKFIIGAEQTIKGLEIGVQAMKKGEKAELEIGSKYGFGERGLPPKIPPNETLYMEVELVDFVNKKKPIMDMSKEEKLKTAEEFKSKGNEKFRAKLMKEAIECYTEGLNYVDSILELDQPTEEQKQIWISLRLNCCVCLNNLGNWAESKKSSDKVIERYPNNAKAKYLRGIAEKNLLLYDDALSDLNFAFSANPQDEKMKYEIESVKEKKKAQQDKEKRTYEKMFKKESGLYSEKKLDICKVPLYDVSNPRVFLDIQIGKDPANTKKIIIELFAKFVQKAAENFRCLCTGEKSNENQKLCYKGSVFHKLVKGFSLDGGDIEKGDGTGGMSIYGKSFLDEDVWYDHDRYGLISMVNTGPNTNSSQFMIMLCAAQWLNKKHIVFGRIVKGTSGIKEIEQIPIDEKGKPKQELIISNCGMYTENIDAPENN